MVTEESWVRVEIQEMLLVLSVIPANISLNLIPRGHFNGKFSGKRMEWRAQIMAVSNLL